MEKRIFITNGMARCGKDTFAQFLNELIPTMKYSSVDKVKEIAALCGWDGGKTERDRKFLSDLKLLTSEYSGMAFKAMQEKVGDFMEDKEHSILVIDIREPEEIERAKKEFHAETILVENDRVEHITSNMADSNVFHYRYDFVIRNNGTLEEFRNAVRRFAEAELGLQINAGRQQALAI